MRTLVVGDIHGGLRALVQVLERAGVTKADSLIFLGDYVDGWSESPQLIEFLIALKARQNCIFIKGNHDQLFLDWLLGNNHAIDQDLWFQHGGLATVSSYENVNEGVKIAHIGFLQSLQDYYIDSHNRLFVHAGFTNMHGVTHEYFPKLLYWDRTLWETALALDTTIAPTSLHYPKRFALYHEIYIGHTPVTRIGVSIPLQKANVWNLDTGAAFTGPLTIMDINSKKYWQSDALPSLYGGEVGRN
jgi:serine/threonine protein phosphatase 1